MVAVRRRDVAIEPQCVVQRVGHQVNPPVVVKISEGQPASAFGSAGEIAAAGAGVREMPGAIAAKQEVLLRVGSPEFAELGFGYDRPAAHSAIDDRNVE